jgi:flagellar biosynthesis protein FlhG
MKPDQKNIIFSTGGGKGGVGKSIFSVALGCHLAKEGKSVALVDLDLGGANLHTYLGLIKKTPTIADFILRKVPSLEEILLETSQKNLKLISGAEFVPGMANPAHWMKLKIIRHVKSLPADFIIMDLGAGVHFNTLDFFGMSDRGVVLTAAEPAAIMNAYSFIKGALFRKLQHVFKKHTDIGPIIDAESKRTTEDSEFSLEWLTGQVKLLDPDMLSVIQELEKDFQPALVVNRQSEGRQHVLVKNLISLCNAKLGVTVEHIGNLPDIPEITDYLLNIPKYLDIPTGEFYLNAAKNIADKLIAYVHSKTDEIQVKTDFTDEEVETIIKFMEALDDSVFSGTKIEAWKLRMHFKPSTVIKFLTSKGITHELFFMRNAGQG